MSGSLPFFTLAAVLALRAGLRWLTPTISEATIDKAALTVTLAMWLAYELGRFSALRAAANAS